ncbi:hypothetical protein PG994_012064 [Apiospora phragmitis]|uniref:DUF4328 domain-containing protein n=1 Tax=Apiospora phragmitis TaxID=2905665 RepID=A0ABR1TUK1_9PEZI
MFQPSLLAVPWALSALAILLIEAPVIWTRLLDPPTVPPDRLRLLPLTLPVVLNAATRAAWVAARYALVVWPLPALRRRHDAFFYQDEGHEAAATATTTPTMTAGRAAAVVACAALWGLQMLGVLAWFGAELVVRGGDEGVGAVLRWMLPPMVGWLVVVVAVVSYCGLGVYILLKGVRTCLFALRRAGWGRNGSTHYVELS